MRSALSIILIALSSVAAFAQGWVTKSARVVLKNDAHIVVDGANGHYLNKGSGLITTTNDGTVHVDGNWTNNGLTPAVGNNAGKVILSGAVQTIGGTTSTSFNSLSLEGNADKYLAIETLVGGGYKGVRSGQLSLTDKHLHMQTNSLIINNSNTSAVTRTTGMLIGETPPGLGYSTVQWNVRSSPSGTYEIPFGSVDFIYIPVRYTLSISGVQSSDSGYISVATYPTVPITNPNNRPLPTGVAHLDNEFGVENDIKSVDRYYITNASGYGTLPTGSFGFSYIEREYDGSLGGGNVIDETLLEAAFYSFAANNWDYQLKGSTNAGTNQTQSATVNNYTGAWVLHEPPLCPIANFTFKDACYNEPISFSDSSYILRGTIDSTVWHHEGQLTINEDPLWHQFSGPGFYDIKRKVKGDRGCWDSIVRTIQVYPIPDGGFDHSDTCFAETTQFAASSTSLLGNVVNQEWLIENQRYQANDVAHKFGTSGDHVIRLVTQNSLGCLDTLFRTITVEPLPVVDFTFDDICQYLESEFVNTSTSKGTITDHLWHIDNLPTSTQQNFKQVFNNDGSYLIKLIEENAYGCRDSNEKTLNVWPKAVAKFDYFPKEIFITDPYVNFVQTGSNANSWEWRFGDFSAEEYGEEAFHQYADTGLFSVRLLANNGFNCPDTFFRTILIKPDMRIFLPNAFSPGTDDDVNTTFGPAGMLYSLKEMEMDIYNRWGELVYHSEELSKPWDGYYQGKLVQPGIYMYLIKVKDIYNSVLYYSGQVNVVR